MEKYTRIGSVVETNRCDGQRDLNVNPVPTDFLLRLIGRCAASLALAESDRRPEAMWGGKRRALPVSRIISLGIWKGRPEDHRALGSAKLFPYHHEREDTLWSSSGGEVWVKPDLDALSETPPRLHVDAVRPSLRECCFVFAEPRKLIIVRRKELSGTGRRGRESDLREGRR